MNVTDCLYPTEFLYIVPEFQIFIRNVREKTIPLHASLTDSIQDIKTKIQKIAKIPSEQQRLTYAGRHLDDKKIVSDYNIMKESTLFL